MKELKKILAIIVQRPKYRSASKESLSKSLAVNDASEEESNDNSNEEDDELSMITRKIRSLFMVRTFRLEVPWFLALIADDWTFLFLVKDLLDDPLNMEEFFFFHIFLIFLVEEKELLHV